MSVLYDYATTVLILESINKVTPTLSTEFPAIYHLGIDRKATLSLSLSLSLAYLSITL